MKRIIAVFLALVLTFGTMTVLTSCSKEGGGDVTTTTSAADEITLQQKTTEPATQDILATTEITETSTSTTSVPESSEVVETTQPQNVLPSSKAEILAKYTEVMQHAKTANPKFTKIEYQDVPADKRNFDGSIFKILLSLANLFIRTEDDARKDPEIHEKGHDMYWFPVYETEKGCMLKDDSMIKTAKCEQLSDGNVKITIVLKNEKNPEPSPEGATVAKSAHGAMFSPLSRVGIDNTLKNDGAINIVVKDVEYTLEYYDCTAILVFNPTNNHVVSLDQFMHTLVIVHSGKVLGSNATGNAVLDNYLYIYDFEY